MGLGNWVTWMVFESRDTTARRTLLAGVSVDSINSNLRWGGVGSLGSLGSLLSVGDSVLGAGELGNGELGSWLTGQLRDAFLFEPLVLLGGVILIKSFSFTLGSRLLSTHMQCTTPQIGQETLVFSSVPRSGILSFLDTGKFVVVLLIVIFWLL